MTPEEPLPWVQTVVPPRSHDTGRDMHRGDEREEYAPAKLFVAHLSISQVKQLFFLPPGPSTQQTQGGPPPSRAALAVHKRLNNCLDRPGDKNKIHHGCSSVAEGRIWLQMPVGRLAFCNFWHEVLILALAAGWGRVRDHAPGLECSRLLGNLLVFSNPRKHITQKSIAGWMAGQLP